MMKTIFTLCCAFVFVIGGCKRPATGNLPPTNTAAMTTISLPTLKCNTCVATVKRTLSSLDGVESAEVDLKAKNVTVHYLTAKLDVGRIEVGISKAGYDANNIRRDSSAHENLPECCK